MPPLMWPEDNGDVENYRGYQIKIEVGLYSIRYNGSRYTFDNLTDTRKFIDIVIDGVKAAAQVVDEYVEQ